ncbi:DUF1850 domain-containing protein [Halalkalibacillus sediminis]|nr:DUF1850 domain-containing protein [Halalkalibacillus sediminis]
MMSSNQPNDQHNQKALLLNSNAFFNKKFIAVLLIILLTVAIVFFLNTKSPYKKIVIEDIHTGDTMWQEEVEKGDWFSHRYIHSVEKSPVEEKFKVDEDWVILTMESWTKSFGAGLPYERKGDVEMKDGYYILRNLNRPVHGGVLRMQPSELFPHSFFFEEQEVVLSEPPYSDTQILIEIQDMTWKDKLMATFG